MTSNEQRTENKNNEKKIEKKTKKKWATRTFSSSSLVYLLLLLFLLLWQNYVRCYGYLLFFFLFSCFSFSFTRLWRKSYIKYELLTHFVYFYFIFFFCCYFFYIFLVCFFFYSFLSCENIKTKTKTATATTIWTKMNFHQKVFSFFLRFFFAFFSLSLSLLKRANIFTCTHSHIQLVKKIFAQKNKNFEMWSLFKNSFNNKIFTYFFIIFSHIL